MFIPLRSCLSSMAFLAIAALCTLSLPGCLANGTPLADYENWLRANGYLADPDAVSDVATADGVADAAADNATSDAEPDAAAADVPTADLGAVSGCPIVAAGTACSGQGGKAMGVNFTNGCTATIKVYWVDFACKENLYHEIAPGMSQVQSTFADHIWRLRDAASGELLREYVVPNKGALLEVGVP